VSKTERRAARAGLDWAAVEALDDGGLEQRMYGGPRHARRDERALPDPVWMHAELRRPGVTLELCTWSTCASTRTAFDTRRSATRTAAGWIAVDG
jgi:hypothetical protein